MILIRSIIRCGLFSLLGACASFTVQAENTYGGFGTVKYDDINGDNSFSTDQFNVGGVLDAKLDNSFHVEIGLGLSNGDVNTDFGSVDTNGNQYLMGAYKQLTPFLVGIRHFSKKRKLDSGNASLTYNFSEFAISFPFAEPLDIHVGLSEFDFDSNVTNNSDEVQSGHIALQFFAAPDTYLAVENGLRDMDQFRVFTIEHKALRQPYGVRLSIGDFDGGDYIGFGMVYYLNHKNSLRHLYRNSVRWHSTVLNGISDSF